LGSGRMHTPAHTRTCTHTHAHLQTHTLAHVRTTQEEAAGFKTRARREVEERARAQVCV